METAVSSAKERAPVNQSPAEAGAPGEPTSLAPAVEAILMSVERPVSAAAIALGLTPPPTRSRAVSNSGKAAEDGESGPDSDAREAELKADPTLIAGVEAAIRALNESYTATGRSFRIEHVAGGYRLMTLPQFARAVGASHRSRLSKAAVETLAIIAYKQPITRADLEAIRGVACGEVLRSLMDRRLITIKGRAEELGRPLLYGTTKQFLDAFGLASLADLPQMTELKFSEINTGGTAARVEAKLVETKPVEGQPAQATSHPDTEVTE